MSGVLNTNGQVVEGTVAELDDFDTIQVSADEPFATVKLRIGDAGVLDLSDELDTGVDADGDGETDDRSAIVYGSELDGDDITTGSGDDILIGSDGDDVLHGGAGNDTLYGGLDRDTLFGGDGDDTLSDQMGNNTLEGGAGDDLFDLRDHSDGTNDIDGGTGIDTLVTDNLDGFTVTNVEVLKVSDGSVEGTAQQLDAFTTIEIADDPYGTQDVPKFIRLVGSGEADLSDELGSQSVLVQTSWVGNSITTGSGNDRLEGNEGNDHLSGGDGHDMLSDQAGTNVLDGGAGNDTLVGGYDDDTLLGGEGNDHLSDNGGTNVLDGGVGDDVLVGGYDNDTLLGGEGNDSLSDEAGTNVLDGGAGDDELAGGYDNDTIIGGAGHDTLAGGEGDDELLGGEGNDYFLDNSGQNTLDGGAGGDTFDVNVDPYDSHDSNEIDGGTGTDVLITDSLWRLDVSNVEVLSLRYGYVEATAAQLEGFDTIQNDSDPTASVEIDLDGAGIADLSDELGSRNAYIQASWQGNTIISGAGDDDLRGSEGNDVLRGGDGDDEISDDYYDGGTNVLDGGAGNDTITASGSSVTIEGGEGDDVIDVEEASGTVHAGAGNDTISVDEFSGTVDGGVGEDSILTYGDLAGGNLTITNVEVLKLRYGYVEATVAQINSFSRIEVANDPTGRIEVGLVGAGVLDLSDKLAGRSINAYASDLGNTIISGSGEDVLRGGHGDDVLRAGAGDDRIYGGSYDFDDDEDYVDGGTDVVDGGAGDDRIWVGHAAKGTVEGGSGNDTVNAWGDISALTIRDVETLAVDQVIKATAWQLDSFDRIVDDADDFDYDDRYSYDLSSGSQLRIQLVGEGGADLSDELGDQAVRITASASGSGIVTGGGDDILLGGAGNDWLAASAGDDMLKGGLGDDVLVGGDGADYLNGGRGTNTVAYTGGEGVTVALDGSLTATNDAIGDVFHGIANLSGSWAADRLRGNDSANFLDGGAGNDRLEGRDDNDTLLGGEGNDILLGGEGDDILVGGAGQDTLNGGAGFDDFVFAVLGESGASGTTRDIVNGFTKGQDDLVLSGIDAKVSVAGNQAFVLDANSSFSAGEIRQTVVSGGLLIELNVDSDGAAEMSVLLAGVHSTLGAGDFVL